MKYSVGRRVINADQIRQVQYLPADETTGEKSACFIDTGCTNAIHDWDITLSGAEADAFWAVYSGDALDDFERAFVLNGTKAEFNRSGKLILPFVNRIPYEFVLAACDCEDLEVHYLRDYTKPGAWFYSICHAHRLQPLGKATRCPHQSDEDRNHRRRLSGMTTAKWYHARGL